MFPPPPGPYANVVPDPNLVTITTDSQGHGSAEVTLYAFSYGASKSFYWVADSVDVNVSPNYGKLTSGSSVTLTLTVEGNQGLRNTWLRIGSSPTLEGDYTQESVAAVAVE